VWKCTLYDKSYSYSYTGVHQRGRWKPRKEGVDGG